MERIGEDVPGKQSPLARVCNDALARNDNGYMVTRVILIAAAAMEMQHSTTQTNENRRSVFVLGTHSRPPVRPKHGMRLTFLEKERKDPSQNSHTVESLIEINVVRGLNDLAKLGGGLGEEGGQILESFVSELPRCVRSHKLKHLLGRRGNLPQLVPEFSIIGRHIDLNEGRDGLAEFLPGRRGSHCTSCLQACMC